MLTHNPRFVLPIRGYYTLACLLHCMCSCLFLKHHCASLRIGLRCFYSSRCRVPARISISETSTPRHIKEPAPHWHHSEDGPERETVDIPASAQVPNDSQAQVKTGSSFTAYNSVLSYYPFLGGRSLGPQEKDDTLNLKQLKMQAAARRLSENQFENARICQFEVPGGGECRDADCGDMHLSQLEVEPNDDETARYMCGDQNVAQIVQALQAARARRPEATFNERVKEAWESMRVQASLGIKT
ncbi:hypothetical protein EDB83DRAFT_1001189 [Lactarius deliciosus]|nr:hypothetical protein EDB83DRAFT_1001189 [Lactarius deliciosus]